MRWQRHAIMPDDATGHTAINVHRKSQQHVQTLSLLRATTPSHHRFHYLTTGSSYSFQLDCAGEYSIFLDPNVMVDEADVGLQSGLNRVDIYRFSSELKTLAVKYKCDPYAIFM